MQEDKLKISLARKILSVRDKDLLSRISALLNEYSETIALSTSGIPLNLKEYNDMLAAAEEEIDKGRTISTSDLRGKLKKWQESKG